MPKVVDIPHLSALIASRNAVDMSGFVAVLALASHIASFDGLAEAFPDLVAQAQRKLFANG